MSKTTTVRTGGTGVDTSDFRNLATALRKAGTQSSRDLKKGLRGAGEIVAVKARAIAGEHSKSIPPTIKVRVSATTVSVVAGGPDSPVAILNELGNTRAGRSAVASTSGTFRHPVYGNRDVWVEQARHPFLAPAAVSESVRMEAKVVESLDAAARTIVFDGA